jgi:DNA repair protein SbcC/Rad50
MKITIKRLTLTNFKGIRSLNVLFNAAITNIFGRNSSGKTTILDAFLWLFFGKNSNDVTDFNIKTLDENNKAYHNLNHEVEAVVVVNKQEITVRRAYREKWTKKRGTNTPEFDGHTHEFFWNDVPLKESEFKAKVAAIIDEKLLKLLTNTTYFNNLKWQERRNVLLSIAGNISDADVFENINADVEELKKAFEQGKTLEEFKREIVAKRKKIKDELDLIPTRIEEANRSLPETVDYAGIEKNMFALKEEIIGIDQLLNNKSAALKEHQQTINKLLHLKQEKSRTALDIENNATNQVQEAARKRAAEIMEQKTKLRSITDEVLDLRKQYANKEEIYKDTVTGQDHAREAWNKINEEQLVFNDDDFCCPACKRAFETADIETKKAELTANFNADKSKRLTAAQKYGLGLKEKAELLKVELENIKAKGLLRADDEQRQKQYVDELEQQHQRLITNEADELNKYLTGHKEYNQLKAEIKELESQIDAPAPEQTNNALTLRKNDLQKQVDEMNRQLAGKDQREKILARIAELKKQEETLSQEYASLDGIEYSIEQFNRAKMDTLEQRINGRFKMVRFQMYEEQVNGGLTDACITLVNSNGSFVPYADANTAAKIQAGIDIINTLSNHYDIKAPVWIDNRESVTDIPETDLQVINLIVSAEHDKLTVEKAELEEAAA